MGTNFDDVQKMVRIADTDNGDEVTFKQFLRAYHTNEWFKVHCLLPANQNISADCCPLFAMLMSLSYTAALLQ